MALVTYADLTAPARTDAKRKVYELVAMRVQERARPMPPDPTKRLSDAAIAVLQAWAAAAAAPGQACAPGAVTTAGAPSLAAMGGMGPGPVPVAGVSGSVAPPLASAGMSAAASSGSAGRAAGAAGSSAASAGQGAAGMAAPPATDADIETCYELRAHGQPVPGDKSRYTVPPGETYTGFIFQAPWTKPVQGLRFRHLPDNKAVLHHWLLYSETAPLADGSFEECALSGPTGFLCGQASTRALITGWAPGREDFRMPAGVGLELPAPGALMAIEFHYYNPSATATDQSGAEVCVTSTFRPNTASVTWLGTQQINIPARAMGTANGTCRPLRAGMNATDPIHILYSWPHMHKLGTHMKTVVSRVAGMPEVLYDGDFSFEFQVLHDSPLLLQPGDSLTTTCTYQNTTAATVTFGASTDKEMCFNFAYSWPAHALDNPGAELGGASNTCLH